MTLESALISDHDFEERRFPFAPSDPFLYPQTCSANERDRISTLRRPTATCSFGLNSLRDIATRGASDFTRVEEFDSPRTRRATSVVASVARVDSLRT